MLALILLIKPTKLFPKKSNLELTHMTDCPHDVGIKSLITYP